MKERDFVDVCKKSTIYFTNRVRVNWGGYSQIKAELILLEAAVKNGPYNYYHLLTGVDLPLKKQSEILKFFDVQREVQFISVEQCNDNEFFMGRAKYYYPVQEFFGRDSDIGRKIRKILLKLQKKLGVNRLKFDNYGVGSAYFDITDEFARYVLNRKKEIYKNFKMGICVDEIFIQTLWLNSKGFCRYESTVKEHEYIQKTYLDILRAIDWTRGFPYTYREEDYEMLMESGCLFARKFSTQIDRAIIERIMKKVSLD